MEGLKDSEILGEFIHGGCKSGETVEKIGVDLSGIGLSADRKGYFEAHLLCDPVFKLRDFTDVAIEKSST